ncbi:MAG: TlpA disulfide reductase family protein [Bryobacteraceae bacterium]
MTRLGRLTRLRAALLAAAALFAGALTLRAQNRIVWNDEEKPIVEQLRGLRSLNDAERGKATLQLAMRIRQLGAAAHKEPLAEQLANLATEGDAGQDTLQEVATTLAQALKEQPPAPAKGGPDMAYVTLAQLVRYEHVRVSSDSPQFAAAMAKLEADDQRRQSANFILTDLTGKSWSLRDLRGKVVLVNFWATWCPPCRKEMPDLEALYRRFSPRGLVILAISDEDAAKVQPFVTEHRFSYPILLDPGRKVNETFQVEGIPKSFVYDREGRLTAQAIDMRTQRQFLAMLAQAGLE